MLINYLLTTLRHNVEYINIGNMGGGNIVSDSMCIHNMRFKLSYNAKLGVLVS